MELISEEENNEEEVPTETEPLKSEKKCHEYLMDMSLLRNPQDHYDRYCLQYNPSLYHHIVSPPPEVLVVI